MNMKTLLWGTVAAGLVWWFVRHAALYDHEVRKATGVQAALDAQASNTYTTYNTSLYVPPLFMPIVRFFKAGAYVPTQNAGQQPAAQVNYSIQG